MFLQLCFNHKNGIMNTGRPSNTPNVDLSYVKVEAQRRLFKLLDHYEGTKTIVWDDKLIGPFEFVASASLLRKHDATKLFRLSDVRLSLTTSSDHTLFFLRKDYQVAKFVADILQRAGRAALSKTTLVFVPQRCASIEKLLEQNKIDLQQLNSIDELEIELFVLDTDILSMENEFVYRDMYLYEDYSIAHQIAQALNKLQDVYGQIPRISGQGKGAKLVTNLLLKQRKQQSSKTTSQTPPPQIQQLILIDRRIDLITPFLTQLTYEGLLDEIFNINHGSVTLPADKFNKLEEQKRQQNPQAPPPQGKPKDTKRFELRSSEELFSKLRDSHINAVAEVLKQSAKNLQNEYDECSSEGKTIREMGLIVKRLNHLKVAKNSQSNHVTIAEIINEHTLKPEFILGLRIEHELLQDDHLNRILPDVEIKLLRQEPSMNILRLVCLQSIINNGLKPKVCDSYKREFIQNYGDEYLLFLLQLEKTNLLLTGDKFYDTGSFNQLKNKFNLINDNVNECNPNHLSYVYGGYSPLSVMVVKTLIQSTQSVQWRLQSEALRLLPQPTVNHFEPNFTQTTTEKQSNLGVLGGYMSVSESILSSSAAATAASLLLSGAGSLTGQSRVRRNSATSSQSSSEDSRIVLVFFIGGCTFAEISALRYLSQQDDNNCEFLIATTKIINGRNFLKSLWPLNHASKLTTLS